MNVSNWKGPIFALYTLVVGGVLASSSSVEATLFGLSLVVVVIVTGVATLARWRRSSPSGSGSGSGMR